MIERRVPGDAELLSVQLDPGGETGTLATPRIASDSVEGDRERHRPGNAPQGQATGDEITVGREWLNAIAAEDDVRVIRRVQEIGAPQVDVALVMPGVDARRCDDELDRRPLRNDAIERHGAAKAAESAM